MRILTPFAAWLVVPTLAYSAATCPRSIKRDVAIIGGGSSGTYAAIRLNQLGKKVVVIEQKGVLGGHTETYHDPITGGTYDIGVQVFHNEPLVTDYAATLGVPLTTLNVGLGGTSTIYADFRTGIPVDFQPPSPAVVGPALQRYAAILANYPFLAEPGYNLPDPVPQDLLLPLGEFVKKYDIGDLVYTFFSYSQGGVNVLDVPAMYWIKQYGPSLLASIQAGFLITARRNNHELYESALTILGQNVLLNTTVVSTQRRRGCVELLVASTNGCKTTIKAKKVIVAIPPVINNFRGWDLDRSESSLFSKFNYSQYVTAILRNDGVAANTSINNAGNDIAYGLPVLPGAYGFSNTGIPNIQDVYYGSPSPLPADKVRQDILATLNRLYQNDVIDSPANVSFEVFSDHTPYWIRVGPREIKAGFYKKLMALQGYRDTYYTGAAWEVNDSSMIWNFTETRVVAPVVAALRE